MTEAEWLRDMADTGGRQLAVIQQHASVRKLRLIAAAYIRRAEPWRPRDEVISCDDVIETVADTPQPWEATEAILRSRPGESWQFTHIMLRDDPDYVVKQLRKLMAFYPVEERHRYATELIHEVVGNPFRPVTPDPAWLTADVVALARGIYDDRAFDRLPILADALQDAGCENADVLGHCRDPQLAHVRGCWVVDLVLGKT